MNRRALVALVRKDLVLELRGREVVLAMVVFVLAAFVLFRFGLGGQSLAGGPRAAVGVLWIATVFTAMLGLTRSFAAEREGRVWDGLLASPVDRATLWAARSISFLLFMLVVQVVAVPAFWLFFLQSGRGPSMPVLIAALVLADIGIAALGSLLAGLGICGPQPRGARAGALPALCDPACDRGLDAHCAHDFPANRRFLHRQTARISGLL